MDEEHSADIDALPTVTDERLAAWRSDAEWSLRHGKLEDGVPPTVVLALIAEVERTRVIPPDKG